MTAKDTTTTAAAETIKTVTHLAAALKAPRITEAAARLADHARDTGWTHEEYLAAVLEREVAARNASGAQLRIRAAGMPAIKTIEDFDFDHQPTARTPIHALASGAYLSEHRNVVLLGPPGTGKTHCETRFGGPLGPLGTGVTVSVLVTTADPKQPTDPPAGGVFAVDLSSWSPAPAWPTIVGLIRSLAGRRGGRASSQSCRLVTSPRPVPTSSGTPLHGKEAPWAPCSQVSSTSSSVSTPTATRTPPPLLTPGREA